MFLDKYINLVKTHEREDGSIVSNDGKHGISIQAKRPVEAEELGLLIPEKEKTAAYTLSNDTQKWNKEIMTQLHEGKDWLDVDSFYIKWKQNFDGEEGYGLGTIVLEKEGREISIPIVIKNYELQPFDVFFSPDEEKIMPLTQSTVESAFYNTELADEVVDKKKRNRSPINDIFPPRMGKYVYGSMDISKEDKEEFIEKLQDKEIMKKADGNEAFLKIAREFAKKEPIDIDRHFKRKEKIASAVIEPEDTKGYRMYWEQDGLKVKEGSYKTALDFLQDNFKLTKEASDKLLRSVDNGEKEAVTDTNKTKEQESLVKPKHIDRSNKIVTKDKFGNEVKGFAIPKLYSFQTGKISEEGLLVDKDRKIIAHEPKILGVPLQEGMGLKDLMRKHVAQMVTRDSVISFMWFDNKYNDFVATQPIRILDYEEVENVGRIYSVMTKLGSYHRVMLGDQVKQPDFAANNKYNAVVLPGDAKILMFDKENKVELIKSLDKFERNLKKESSVLKAAYFKNTNEIEIKSEHFEKTASPREIELELLKEGFSKEDTNDILEKVAKDKNVTINYRADMEKTANLDRKEEILDDIIKEARAVRDKFDLVKIAAGIDSVETVDKVLALNFINKKNLARVFQALPDLKQSALKLAELLLYARIGNIGVPEESIAEAMKSLQYLIEKLEGYEI